MCMGRREEKRQLKKRKEGREEREEERREKGKNDRNEEKKKIEIINGIKENGNNIMTRVAGKGKIRGNV